MKNRASSLRSSSWVEPEGAAQTRDMRQDRLGNSAIQERMQSAMAAAGAVAHTGGKASIPGTPSPPPANVEDGSAEQEDMIQAALDEARKSAARGMSILRGGPSSQQAERLLNEHFHTTGAGMLRDAASRMSEVQSGLSGIVPIEVEGSAFPFGDQTRGYIYGGPLAGFSDIHLTPRFFGQDVEDQARTLIHEASHKYAGTEDHARNPSSEYWNLSPEMAIENADSYAWLCRQA